MQTHARLANIHTPQLHSHDRFGRRIDQVEFHPSYHALMTAATAPACTARPGRSKGASPHVLRAAGFMLFTELEPSVLCPISMTYAVTPALRGNAAIYADWGPKLASRSLRPGAEALARQGRPDHGHGHDREAGRLGRARQHDARPCADGQDDWGQRFRVTGHKWFLSAPMCDAFLVLAQAPGGLSCFFLPRVLPDGSLNAMRIQRLKDKLGNKANASSEVEFHQAHGLAGRARKAAACRRSSRWAR